MHDARQVRRRERVGQRTRRREDRVGRWTLRARNLVAQRPSIHVFGGDVDGPVQLLERIDRADARVGQTRRRARLAFQPFAVCRISGELGRQGLEGDRPAETRVKRQIDAPHSATTDLVANFVGAEDGTGLERVVLDEQIGHRLGDGPREERPGLSMVVPERTKLALYRLVVGGRAGDPPRRLGLVAIDGLLEQIAHATALVGRHATVALSSRNSHARARAHRRFTVAGERSIASAVSSMLSPAK